MCLIAATQDLRTGMTTFMLVVDNGAGNSDSVWGFGIAPIN